MRFKSLSLLTTAALLAAPLATTSAQYTIGSPGDVCGGNNFTFCVAINAAQGLGTNSANFFITITNEALHGSNAAPYNTLVIDELGFNGFGAAPIIFAASPGTSFVQSNNITEFSNFPGTWVGAEASPPPAHNGLLFGEFITFEFLNTTAASFNTSSLALHGQAGPGACSSKFAINLSGGTLPANGPDFISAACGSVVSTPEPASIALVATGLFTMLGLVRRRHLSVRNT